MILIGLSCADESIGAALDIELATRRQMQVGLRAVAPRNCAIFEALMERYTRPAEPRRKVVRTLQKCADANRCYKVEC